MTTIFFCSEPDGEVLAVFPWSFVLNDGKNLVNGGTFDCYSHAGQHSTCTLEYIKQDTKPVAKNDGRALALLDELKTCGYRDIVVMNGIPKMFL